MEPRLLFAYALILLIVGGLTVVLLRATREGRDIRRSYRRAERERRRLRAERLADQGS